MTVDAATTLKLLTPDQAEKIGAKIGQDLGAKGTKLDNLSIQGSTESCNRLLQGIAQPRK